MVNNTNLWKHDKTEAINKIGVTRVVVPWITMLAIFIMSIEMENPKTTVEKIDAASNYVAQIRLAIMTGDTNTEIEGITMDDKNKKDDQAAARESELSAPPGSEPLRIVMSREEIEDKAKAYLLEYVDGKPNDDFYLRLGMMVDFSHFLFQNAQGEVRR